MNLLITGGARGIGAGMVRHFAKNGAQVVFCYRKSDETAEKLSRETGAEAIRCDVGNEEQVRALFETVVRKRHRLDAAVLNAGAAWTGLTEEMPLSEYERLERTNLRGAFLCAREALPLLRETKGSLVMISSMWGRVGASCESVYSATKAGIECFARSLAKEAGPSGVRVNCIAPGTVDTDMMACYSEEDKQTLRDETPLGRLCTAEDIALTADFLLSPGAAFITGQTITVDGGFTL